MGTGVSTEQVPELCWIKVTPTQAPSWKWKVCSDVLQMKGGERGEKKRERKKNQDLRVHCDMLQNSACVQLKRLLV